MRSHVDIVLIGDRDVGKTTLITSAQTGKYEPNVPPLLEVIPLPPETLREPVAVSVTDTSLRCQEEGDIVEAVKAADAICIVFAADDEESMIRVSTYWMPLITDALPPDAPTPVLMIGNKIDLIEEQAVHQRRIEQHILPLMSRYDRVEMCIECSARTQENLAETFHVSYKAVVYPIAPLYDARSHRLQPAAVSALTRVFKLCDQDKDELLCDEELQAFQNALFQAPLSQEELANVKAVVTNSTRDGVANGALTLTGFLYIQKLFIERGRIEATWTILWAFGYDDDLSLNEEYMCPTLELEKDSVPEISPIGMEFLIRLFRQYDVDGSGLLSQEQLERVFEVCPAVPWADDVYPASDELEWTLEQFISLWVYLCWSDPSAFMRTLAYLGFNFRTPTNTHGSVKDAIRPSRARREERRVGKSTRTVHVLFIFGKQQAGKTSLLKALARTGSQFVLGYKSRKRTCVGCIEHNGDTHHLILREFAVNGDDHEVISSSYCADKCDVAALCFDVTDPSSFAHAADLQAAVVRPGPRCVMLACKADEVAVEQQFPLQPPEYSRQHNIPLVQVSSQRGDTDDAFAALVDQASKPRESDGGLGSGISSRSLSWLRTAGAIAAAAVAAYFAFRALRLRRGVA